MSTTFFSTFCEKRINQPYFCCIWRMWEQYQKQPFHDGKIDWIEIGVGNGLRQFGKFRNSIEWDWTVAACRILRKKCDTNPKLTPKTRTRTNSFRYENHFKWKRGWADQIQYAARKKWNLFIIFGNCFFLCCWQKKYRKLRTVHYVALFFYHVKFRLDQRNGKKRRERKECTDIISH